MTWMLAGVESAAGFGSVPGSLVILLDAAARALVVAAVVGAGLWAMRATNVVAQKVAWGLVLAGALAMPVAAPWAARSAWTPAARIVVPSPVINSPIKSEQPVMQTTMTSAVSTAVRSNPVASLQRNSSLTAKGAAQSEPMDIAPADRFPAPSISSGSTDTEIQTLARPAKPLRRLPTIPALLWLIYGTVAGLLLLRLCYGLGAAIGLWQSAEPVTLKGAEGLHLRSSRKVSSPVTVGSGIVLPADHDEWDAEKLRIVMAHEMSHVRQKDFYLQALAGLYAALFWFSPLGWWLKRKLSDLGEAISDRAGLDEAGSPAGYAQVLLEFAALPRLSQTGVAMARSGNVAHRIERLLNENRFRQAFAGSRGRLLAAALLAPVAIFAAAAMIRVEAAGQAPATPAPPAQSSALAPAAVPAPPAVPAGQPDPAEVPDADAAPDEIPAPAVPPVPARPGTASTTTLIQNGGPDAPPPPPPPVPEVGAAPHVSTSVHVRVAPQVAVSTSVSESRSEDGQGHSKSWGSGYGKNYAYSYQSDGESYAVISGKDKEHVRFSGDWINGKKGQLDKAKQMAHGDFLWFTHDGKSYVVDDPAAVEQIEKLYAPMDELGRQQKELSRRQEELGKMQEDMSEHWQEIKVPKPDLTKELANLSAEIARIQAIKATEISQAELQGIEGKLAAVQAKLGSVQGEIGARAGELGRKEGELGAQQGKLGAEQGRLGAEEGRIAREADRTVKSIIDQSLKDGKAKPVE